jgi:hypothetical protein
VMTSRWCVCRPISTQEVDRRRVGVVRLGGRPGASGSASKGPPMRPRPSAIIDPEVVVIVVVVDVGVDFVGTADSQAGGVAALDHHEARVAVLVEHGRATHLVVWNGAPDAPEKRAGGYVKVCASWAMLTSILWASISMMAKSSVPIEIDPHLLPRTPDSKRDFLCASLSFHLALSVSEAKFQ